jgi:hypothetical protein
VTAVAASAVVGYASDLGSILKNGVHTVLHRNTIFEK